MSDLRLEGKVRGGAVARWHLPTAGPLSVGQLTWCGLRLRGVIVRGVPARERLAAGEGRVCEACVAAQATGRPRSWRRR